MSEQPDLTKLGEAIAGAIEQKAYQCPHCEKPIHLTNVAQVAPKTVLTMTLESNTGAFSAHTVGATISNFDKLLKMIAKDVGGKVHVFVDSLQRTEKSLTVGFLITAVLPSKAQSSKKKSPKHSTG